MGQQNQRFIRRNWQQQLQNLHDQLNRNHHNHSHPRHQQSQHHHQQQRTSQQQQQNQEQSRQRPNSQTNDNNNTEMNRHINQNNNSNVTEAAPEKLDISDVRDPSDIGKLSAKQLKIILTRNCVDYKGVFEKEVLREKVMQLWIDCNERKSARNPNQPFSNDGSQYNNDDIDEKIACKICMEREINCVFLECGHMLTCVTCGRKMAECPVCRQNITRCVRTFKG